jgi:hypothetical protein
MHEIRKRALKFDGFKSFASFALEQGISPLTASAHSEFLRRLTEEIRAAAEDDKFMFGNRTEAMFAALVASLGTVSLLKGEDGLDCFAQDPSLEIPDFRAVLKTGDQMLIEVKNYHQEPPYTNAYRMRANLLQGLQAYAALMKCPLKIAVYWSRWNLWTLNSPHVFCR